MKKERQFTARLHYFEVHVTSTTRDDGTEVHRVTAGFPFENAPKGYEPMEFVLGSASEVLDLLEVVDVSNGLIDTLHGSSDAAKVPTQPQLKLVPDPNREGGDGPSRLERFADEVLTLLAAAPNWGAHTLDELALLADVLGLGESDDSGRFCRIAASTQATGGVSPAGGDA